MVSLLEDAKEKLHDLSFNDAEMLLHFEDGRMLSVPLWWYPRLLNGAPAAREHWEPCAGGRGIHWPELDEDLSIRGILEGRKAPGATPPL